LGVAIVAAPRPFALALAGRDGRRSGTQLLARATGGRDAALGTAAAVALARGRDARLWTAAQLGADMTDLVATAAVGKDLPRSARRVMIGMAASASVVLAGALVGLRDGSRSNGHAGASSEETVPAGRTTDGMGSVVISGESQDDPR
jgi:hypothetical protein